MSPTLLRSNLLNSIPSITHTFTDKHQGSSSGPFNSLNLSTRVGDERAIVKKNRAAVLAAMGIAQREFIVLKQVHSDSIVQVNSGASRAIEADALWTADRNACIGVVAADCVPILIAHKDGLFVAAAHSGWRGTAEHIASKLVKRLLRGGAQVDDLRAAIGPAIGPCCFEVSEDTSSALHKAYSNAPEAFSPRPGSKEAVNLWRLNYRDLRQAGLAPRHIDCLEYCTACSERFFSYRADEGETGRQGALIALI